MHIQLVRLESSTWTCRTAPILVLFPVSSYFMQKRVDALGTELLHGIFTFLKGTTLCIHALCVFLQCLRRSSVGLQSISELKNCFEWHRKQNKNSWKSGFDSVMCVPGKSAFLGGLTDTLHQADLACYCPLHQERQTWAAARRAGMIEQVLCNKNRVKK